MPIIQSLKCKVGSHKWRGGTYLQTPGGRFCEWEEVCHQCKTTKRVQGGLHTWTWMYINTNSCEQEQVCSSCMVKDTSRDPIIAAHRWGNWKEKYLVFQRICDRCGEKESDERAKLLLGPLLKSWKKLDCDNILTDVQKDNLGSELSSLTINIKDNYRISFELNNSSRGWMFGYKDKNKLDEVLGQGDYNPDSFTISRLLSVYDVKQDDGDIYGQIRGILKLTIDSQKIYSHDYDLEKNVLGDLSEIKSAQKLKDRIDKFLANQITH